MQDREREIGLRHAWEKENSRAGDVVEEVVTPEGGQCGLSEVKNEREREI